MTAAVGRRAPRCSRAGSRASIRTKPKVACVWAPHQSSGTGGTTAAASSFFTSRLPTWGPLPWVTTTSTSWSRSSATAAIATSAAAIWSSGRARPSGFVIAFPPSASITRTGAKVAPAAPDPAEAGPPAPAESEDPRAEAPRHRVRGGPAPELERLALLVVADLAVALDPRRQPPGVEAHPHHQRVQPAGGVVVHAGVLDRLRQLDGEL